MPRTVHTAGPEPSLLPETLTSETFPELSFSVAALFG